MQIGKEEEEEQEEEELWAVIAREQMARLSLSGVLDALDFLEIHAAGSRDSVSKVLFKDDEEDEARRGKIHLHPFNHSVSSYEFLTLEALQSYCQVHKTLFSFFGLSLHCCVSHVMSRHLTQMNPHSFVLYLHNKGASRTGQGKEAVTAWRHYLEHFVLDRYETCLEVLAQGYDTCGVQFADDANIYGGNIW